MIAHKGEAATEAWLKGVKANLARKPAGGDREQVRDVHAGLCDIALGNTYYMAAMQKTPDAEGVGRQRTHHLPQRRRPRQPRQHLGHGADEERAEQGRRDEADGRSSPPTRAQKIYAEVINEYPVSPSGARRRNGQELGQAEARRTADR